MQGDLTPLWRIWLGESLESSFPDLLPSASAPLLLWMPPGCSQVTFVALSLGSCISSGGHLLWAAVPWVPMVLILITQWSHTGHPADASACASESDTLPLQSLGGWLEETQGLALHVPRIPLVCSHLPLPMTVSDLLCSSLLLSTSLTETFHTLDIRVILEENHRSWALVSHVAWKV